MYIYVSDGIPRYSTVPVSIFRFFSNDVVPVNCITIVIEADKFDMLLIDFPLSVRDHDRKYIRSYFAYTISD